MDELCLKMSDRLPLENERLKELLAGLVICIEYEADT
jgi:hypothetical protein